MVGVGEGAADGLRVADVAVGAEHAAHGVARLGAAHELLDGAGVHVAVDADRRHQCACSWPRTVRHDCHVMRRMTRVIARPMSGSAIGMPMATTAAEATTASDT